MPVGLICLTDTYPFFFTSGRILPVCLPFLNAMHFKKIYVIDMEKRDASRSFSAGVV